MNRHWLLPLALLAFPAFTRAAEPPLEPADFLLPNEAVMTPFKDRTPILFVTRNQPEWSKLTSFWNDGTQETVDPGTGEKVIRKAVRIKVPYGLTTAPTIPGENPMTVEKWVLGKKLYFDKILSTDGTVACATCHAPNKGFADGKKSSTGIGGNLGPINSPTVFNSAYNKLQFWDGRGLSLEDQAQGPVGNNLEMFAGKADAWLEAVTRIRAKPEYMSAFRAVFGHAPTRDSAAKAIATYERTVLLGTGIQDRAELAMRKRVIEEETGKFELKPEDYVATLKAELSSKSAALKDIGLEDEGKVDAAAKSLFNGRTLFFGKARCSNCHTGDVYSDGAFHNIGVGVVNGELPLAEFGRFMRLPTGHKDTAAVGAFKTPGLRGLLQTAPYMHSGEEKTLEAVVDFYDKGGNVNPYLSEKMRDTAAEATYLRARNSGAPLPTGVATFGASKTPIIPFKLNLTATEKADLVLFLKALNGDPLDPLVADPAKYPK
jgi:cytochrome c peroxidase